MLGVLLLQAVYQQTAALQAVYKHNIRLTCMFSVVRGGSLAEDISAATRIVYLLPAPVVFSELNLAPATASVLSGLPGICTGDGCAVCSDAPLMPACSSGSVMFLSFSLSRQLQGQKSLNYERLPRGAVKRSAGKKGSVHARIDESIRPSRTRQSMRYSARLQPGP